jgi:hypothetical protein
MLTLKEREAKHASPASNTCSSLHINYAHGTLKKCQLPANADQNPISPVAGLLQLWDNTDLKFL